VPTDGTRRCWRMSMMRSMALTVFPCLASGLLVPPATVHVQSYAQAQFQTAAEAPFKTAAVQTGGLFPGSTLIADTDSELEACFAVPACKARFDQIIAEKRAEKAQSATPAAEKVEELSPAKAKILAAKQAAAAKAAAGGFKEAEGKAFALNLPDKSEKDPLAEANELRAKIRVLKEESTIRPLSKSKSAQLQQLRQMEETAREKGNREIAKREDMAERAQRRDEAKAAKMEPASDASYSDSLSKITGTALPSLPSVSLPSVSLPSLPF